MRKRRRVFALEKPIFEKLGGFTIKKNGEGKSLFNWKSIKGVLHPRPVFGLFLHFSQKLQHIGNK